MDARLKTTLRWLLVVVTLGISSFAAFILGMGLMLWPDRSVVANLLALGITPRAAIEATHRVDFFITILVWIIPPASAIGFAANAGQRRPLKLAVSLSVLLFATFSFFLGRGDARVDVQCVAIVAAVLVLAALALSFLKLKFGRTVPIANFIAILLLFLPSAFALAHRSGAPPQAKELWSTTLQKEQWFNQSMNTGSEYGPTRQVVFAGDRVVVVLNTGFAPSQNARDKWPASQYKIVSLDAKTGAKKNEITFAGRWGAMPYIYATDTGLVDVQSNPPQRINPDLTQATDHTGTVSAIPKQQDCITCNPPRYALTNDLFLQLQSDQFDVFDDTGKIVRKGHLLEWGNFAGASANGSRFATQSSYTEGDPDFVVYEYFTIYDTESGKPIATIHISDLPERQSWSALSPDGRHFIAGNPDKLTMYLLP